MIKIIDNFYKWYTPWQQKKREKFLHSIIDFLIFIKLTPNILTNFRLILLIPLFFLLKFFYWKWSAFLILFSIFTDILDGPLARRLKIASDKGMFLDMFVDNIFFIFSWIFLSLFNFLNVYILIFSITIFMIHNLLSVLVYNEGKKTDWLIKPAARTGHYKVLGYFFILLFLLFKINYLNYFLIFLLVLLSIESLYYYIILQIRWNK